MSIVAAIQMTSTPDVSANLAAAARLIGEAAEGGARLVALPENFYQMGSSETDKLALRELDGRGPLQDVLAGLASRHGVWIVGGTLPLVGDDPARVRAACVVYDDRGERVARYDKIHLFDVVVADSQGQYRESATVEPGTQVVVVDTPFGRLGLSVCYDVRFPELFRAMQAQGAELFTVPAAFTAVTGRAHWETLLRARAVENLAWVLAPAQAGHHPNGRETYGDSLVCDPWGQVLARRAQGEGVVLATLDRERQRQLRRSFPCLEHRRL